MSEQKQKTAEQLGWGNFTSADMVHMYAMAMGRLLTGAVDFKTKPLAMKEEPGPRKIRDE